MSSQIERTLSVLKKKQEHELDILQQKMADILGVSTELSARIDDLEERISAYKLSLRGCTDLAVINTTRDYLQYLYSETEQAIEEKQLVDFLSENLSKQLGEGLIEKRKAKTLIEKNVTRRVKAQEKESGRFMDDVWLVKHGEKAR